MNGNSERGDLLENDLDEEEKVMDLRDDDVKGQKRFTKMSQIKKEEKSSSSPTGSSIGESSCEKTNDECTNNEDVGKSQKTSEDETVELASSSNQGQKQQSVWKVEETSSDGCTFLCPQLQSFNTSLPHQFVNTSQATTIVEHRCHISNSLDATISLNRKPIKGRTFSEFENDKQVGPLLDWVASLRFCIGYPDISLVENARYLQQKKIFLPPQIAKLLNFIKIDEDFVTRRNYPISSEATATSNHKSQEEFIGTLRTPSCRYVAGDFSDICDQCRLLQEPLEFLGL